ncbi:MAG: hypothetical protein ABFD18_00750 [Syntrophomonas sp.]
MNRRALAFAGIALLSVLLIFLFVKQKSDHADGPSEYINEKYGFTLTLDKEFAKSVEIKDKGRTIYLVSRDIQATQPDMIFGVVGRIEIYSKAESTKENINNAEDAYGLKYLGENAAYYFGWAHATDVQIPPGDESSAKNFRILENQADQLIKTFKIKEVTTPELKTDSGRYVGLADNNFFEIKISGVPDEKAAKVFMISDKIRTRFEILNLQPEEEIKIKYIQNENSQNVVQEIEKL